MLNGKRILFIAPEFFHYCILIEQALRSNGAIVDMHYSRPKSKLSKFFFIFSKIIYKKINQRYFKKLLECVAQDYHYIFIIRADLIPLDFLKKIRIKYQGAKFIHYIWDDISLFPEILDSFQYFDRILSYEPDDCAKYGLIFRPFFFVNQYNSEKIVKHHLHDIFFIGSFHTDRLEVLKNVKRLNPNLNFYLHFYINPITFLLNNVIWSKGSSFRFRKMKYATMINIIENSRAILDIQNISQNGLTTRIFEALGAKSKIITSNKNILKYDFYNSENIFIVDRNNPVIEKEWLEHPYYEYDFSLLGKYNINYWILEVFDLKKITI